jgi:hypothetical protein
MPGSKLIVPKLTLTKASGSNGSMAAYDKVLMSLLRKHGVSTKPVPVMIRSK